MAIRHLCFCLGVTAAALAAAPAASQTLQLTCSNAGNTYNVGEVACIAACHGARRLARCDRVAERAIWTYVADVCPSARFVPLPPAEASQIPTVALMTPLPGPLKINTIAPDMSLRVATMRIDQPASR